MQSIRKSFHRSTSNTRLMEVFQAQSSKPKVTSEPFWASLHGIAEQTTKRFPRIRQKERAVELFTFPRNETAQVVKGL